jgi:hypothetical protein
MIRTSFQSSRITFSLVFSTENMMVMKNNSRMLTETQFAFTATVSIQPRSSVSITPHTMSEENKTP